MVKSLENLTSNFWNTTKRYFSNLKYAAFLAPVLFFNSCKELPTESEISGLDLQAYATSDTSMILSWNKIKNVDKYTLRMYARRPLFGMSGGGFQQITQLSEKDSIYNYRGTLPKNNFSVSIHATKTVNNKNSIYDTKRDSLIAQQLTDVIRIIKK